MLIAICLGSLLFFGLGFGIRAVVSPWSWSLFRKQTLTGSWYGNIQSAHTTEAAMLLKLHIPYRLHFGYNLSGEVRSCDAGGELTTYKVLGNSDGSSVNLKLFADQKNEGNRRLSFLQGEWHGESLALKGEIYSKSGPGRDVPVTMELRKGSETDYNGACSKFSSRSQ